MILLIFMRGGEDIKIILFLNRIVCLSTAVLISLFILSTASFAATFNPATVEQLIMDIQTANANAEADDINLVPGMVYTITGMEAGVPFTNGNGNNGLPIIVLDVMAGNGITINGNGATIQRDPSLFTTDPCDGPGISEFRIFQVDEDADLTLNGVTIQNGCAAAGGSIGNSGGGIYNDDAILTITNSTISGNRALRFGGGVHSDFGAILTITNSTISGNQANEIGNGSGGGVSNRGGTLTITNSTISSNVADSSGGGVHSEFGAISTITNSTISGNETGAGLGGGGVNNQDSVTTITNSTISGNQTDANGGGVQNVFAFFSAALMIITNSTISGNEARNQGGGVFNLFDDAILTITNSTISGNVADSSGGGVANALDSTTELKNTLIVDNTAENCFNFDAVLINNGGNISDDNSDDCAFAFNADWDTATMLGPLQYNGGGTHTHALIETMMPSNPAIDAILPADCTDQQMVPVAITDDQRFFPRPFGANCDVGAFEAQPTGMLAIEKITVPAGGTGFEFLGTNFPEGCGLMDTFFLDDTETASCILPLDSYTVEEVNVPSDTIVDIMCDQSVTVTDNELMISIGDGDNALCTFTNTEEVTLNLTIAGNGTGTVDITPPGETCEPNCNHTYPFGTEITLTPSEGAFSIFAGFSGDAGCGADITIEENLNCIATFSLIEFLLSVTTSGTGEGTVTAPAGAGDGINCGEGNMNCDELYDATTMVTLTATPDGDSDFTGWSGACAGAGTNQMATVDMVSAQSCDAEFTLKQFDVTVVINGSGTGTVSSMPPGIACPGDCTETYNIHTPVDLTDTPGLGSLPAVWSANCPGGVIADLTEDTVCTATFEFLPLILNPIFPGVASNVNSITVEQATPGGRVAFVWGFATGATTLGGPTCNGLVIDIKPVKLIGFVNAGADQIAKLDVYIPFNPAFQMPVYTQAIDVKTCRISDRVQNIIIND